MKKLEFGHTIKACYLAQISHSCVNNFAPLLFLTFQSSYNIPIEKITLLVTINFFVQLLVDGFAAKFADKIGYRLCVVTAHALIAGGLIGLTVFPGLFSDPFIGLMLAVIIYGCGGGLLEVLVSPIVEACPGDKKSAAMSLLHSFYCWGHVIVVLLSTLFFVTVGIENWRILACIWAVLPLFNSFYFSRVPIAKLVENESESMKFKELFSMKIFWVFIVLMICSGASELTMSQWASAFAESGLGVSKTVGDLAGPCLFAVLMGSSRLLYAKISDKINLKVFIIGSGILCIISYLMATITTSPVLGLVGCAMCGFSVGIMWPGTFSLASARCPRGGTLLFAMLALAGDIGCSGGPTLAGLVMGANDGNMKTGLLAATVFPVLLVLCALMLARRKKA